MYFILSFFIMSAEINKQWYEKWFDSNYYHILYKNRSTNEAAQFLEKLRAVIIPSKNSHIMDLACGRGRHSRYLCDMGYIVTGVDLSSQSIAYAKQFENQNLKFHVHDMRNDFGRLQFDHVLNLFTSFGYFENDNDNILVLKNVQRALKEHGTVLIDFMNVIKAINSMVKKEKIEIEGIQFNIERWVDGLHIKKRIEILDQDKEFVFEESVQALKLEHFKTYFEKAKLKLIRTFGDYDLNEFNENNSERLILLAENTQ